MQYKFVLTCRLVSSFNDLQFTNSQFHKQQEMQHNYKQSSTHLSSNGNTSTKVTDVIFSGQVVKV